MTQSAQVRLGIIGFGSWAVHAFVPAIARTPGAKVVAAAGRSDATQAAARDALGRSARITGDFRKLLDPAVVDAVMVAVTEDQHALTIGAALDSGLPVFYEPPLSDRRSEIPAELARLLAAEQVTHADLELSYLPVVDRGAALVADGAVGSLRDVRVSMTSGWGPVPDSDISLGFQLIPWYVDPLNRVIGRTPARVSVEDGEGVPGRMQSQTLVHLDYGGIKGSFHADIESDSELGARIEIGGDQGEIELDLFAGTLRRRSVGEGEWTTESHPAEQPHAGWPGMHESVSAFVQAVRSGGETRSGASTMAELHKIGLAAEESIDSASWADVQASG